MTTQPGPLFASVPEVAATLGLDVRTVRRAISSEEIPSKRYLGRVLVPMSWLREQAGPPQAAPQPPLPLEELADLVADRVVARLAQALFGTGPPGPVTATSDIAAASPPRNGAA
jgi:hypothetical protein